MEYQRSNDQHTKDYYDLQLSNQEAYHNLEMARQKDYYEITIAHQKELGQRDKADIRKDYQLNVLAWWVTHEKEPKADDNYEALRQLLAFNPGDPTYPYGPLAVTVPAGQPRALGWKDGFAQ
jgi:hypothetical protein